jgi:hypothetical protein
MAIYSRPAKGVPPKQSSSRGEPRSWMAPAVSPPLVRTPAFMLGGRFAVIREPHFMRGVRRDGAVAPESQTAGKPALSVVGPSDESSHGK